VAARHYTTHMCIAGIVGAGLPAIGCGAVVKSVSARRLTQCGTRVDDWVAADCREASLYTKRKDGAVRGVDAAIIRPQTARYSAGRCSFPLAEHAVGCRHPNTRTSH